MDNFLHRYLSGLLGRGHHRNVDTGGVADMHICTEGLGVRLSWNARANAPHDLAITLATLMTPDEAREMAEALSDCAGDAERNWEQ